MGGDGWVKPLPPKKRFSLWCAEMLLPIIGSVQMCLSMLVIAVYGELMLYHGVLIMAILLLISGSLGTLVGCVVNYERFANANQSSRLMTFVAFTTMACACICISFWYIYIAKEMHLFNMHEYLDNPYVKVMIDLTQQTFECCGDCRYTDWFRVDWRGSDIEPGKFYPPNGRSGVPFSCCVADAPSPCSNDLVPDRSRLHSQGCREALTNKFNYLALIEATLLFGSGILQVIWLLCVQPPMSPNDYVEESAIPQDKLEDQAQKVVIDVEVAVEVEEDENIDAQLTALLPDGPPFVKYPIPNRYSCDSLIIDDEEMIKKDPSLTEDKDEHAPDRKVKESSAEDRYREVDAVHTLRSQEHSSESGGEGPKAFEYSTDDSTAEWLRMQLMKDLSASEENEEDTLSCDCPEESPVATEKGVNSTETPALSAETDAEVTDSKGPEVPH